MDANVVPYGAKVVAICGQKVTAPPDPSSSAIDIGAPPVLEVESAVYSAPPVDNVPIVTVDVFLARSVHLDEVRRLWIESLVRVLN